MELSQKIAIARKKKGLTQEQLADLTNITVRTIQRIESGESTPRAYTLKTIATALEISFEELNTTGSHDVHHSAGTSGEANSKHFLEMLCLSCFSYILIPFVHFLVPRHILKKSNEQNPKVVAFARRVIKVQLYWKAALWIIMLLTLAYNIIMAANQQRAYLLNYLWPFFIMYFINALIISVYLRRIRKTDFSLQPSV